MLIPNINSSTNKLNRGGNIKNHRMDRAKRGIEELIRHKEKRPKARSSWTVHR